MSLLNDKDSKLRTQPFLLGTLKPWALMNKIMKLSACIIPHAFSLGTLGLRSSVPHAVLPLKGGAEFCCGHCFMTLRSLIQRKNLEREPHNLKENLSKTFRPAWTTLCDRLKEKEARVWLSWPCGPGGGDSKGKKRWS